MNKIEKYIYNLVKKTPWLKNLTRNLYQSIFDLFPRQKEYSKFPIEYMQDYFFGFHDKSPFSPNADKILANKLTIPLYMPDLSDPLIIGYFNLQSGKFDKYIPLGKSFAWNYHKGCRLQWLNEDKIIFNTALKDSLISKVVDIYSNKETIIDYPIDTVSSDGKWATSFSYERLENLMPGYGYKYADDGYLDKKYPEETGLFLINLDQNSRELILSLNDLVNDETFNQPHEDARHYVTHSEFSFDGSYVSFLHRWTKKDTRDRKTRLIIFDLQQQKILYLPTEGMVSHYVWNRNNQILAFCTIDSLDRHVLFDVPNINSYKIIDSSSINSDGHQFFINNTEFVTDTYPDKFRMAKLFKCNITITDTELLAKLYSPKKYQTKDFENHIACDLHPRVSPCRNYVSFDSVRDNKRSICIMRIPN